MDLKSFQLIASEKILLSSGNLESGFQVKAFFILLEVGYLLTFVIIFVYK